MYCEEKIQLKDAFWGEKVHLIREKVLPYQWEAIKVIAFAIFVLRHV